MNRETESQARSREAETPSVERELKKLLGGKCPQCGKDGCFGQCTGGDSCWPEPPVQRGCW